MRKFLRLVLVLVACAARAYAVDEDSPIVHSGDSYHHPSSPVGWFTSWKVTIEKVGYQQSPARLIWKVSCSNTMAAAMNVHVQVGTTDVGTFGDQQTFGINPAGNASFAYSVQIIYTAAASVYSGTGKNIPAVETVWKSPICNTQDVTYKVIDKQTGEVIAVQTVSAGDRGVFGIKDKNAHGVWIQGTVFDKTYDALTGTWTDTPGHNEILYHSGLDPTQMEMTPFNGPAGVSSTGAGLVDVVPNIDAYNQAAYSDTTATANTANKFAVVTTSFSGASDNVTLAKISNAITGAVQDSGGTVTNAINKLNATVKANGTGGGSGGSGSVDLTSTNTLIGGTNTKLDAVKSAVDTGNAKFAGALNASGKLDLGGVETRLDTTNDRLTTVRDKVDELKTLAETANTRAEDQKTRDDTARGASEDSGKYSGKATEMQTAASGTINGLDSSVSASAPSVSAGSASVFTIAIAGYSFDLDPSSSSEVSTAAAWFKAFLQWALTAGYGWWCWCELERMIVAMASIPQARGNTVAGTGGQISAFLAAGIITVLIFTTIPALWSVASTPTFNAGAFWSLASSIAPTAGSISGALYLLYFFLPVSFILSLIAQMFVFKKFGLATCLGVFSAIKYIVP